MRIWKASSARADTRFGLNTGIPLACYNPSSFHMHVGLTLPFRFDPDRLKSDLALIHHDEWTPHYNQNDYEGDWRGSALRSSTGRISSLTASYAPASTFLDTRLMSRCSYFREAVSAFACPR